MISVGNHQSIRKLLGVSDKLVAYKDFFANNGEYLLRDEVRKAYGLQPIDRGVYEKELMKIDERVNIANMVYSGSIFRMIPIPGDPNNSWVANEAEHHHNHDHEHQTHSSVAAKFFESYQSALGEAMVTKDYRLPGQLLSELESYQKSKGLTVIPSPSRINAEILLNRLSLFNRLAVFYALLGIAWLFMLVLLRV